MTFAAPLLSRPKHGRLIDVIPAYYLRRQPSTSSTRIGGATMVLTRWRGLIYLALLTTAIGLMSLVPGR